MQSGPNAGLQLRRAIGIKLTVSLTKDTTDRTNLRL